MKKAILFAAAALLTACGTDNIELVKNTTGHSDGRTVGAVLDTYSSAQCASHKWTQFETDDGEQIVEWNCISNSTDKAMDYAKQHNTTLSKVASTAQLNLILQFAIVNESAEPAFQTMVLNFDDGKTHDFKVINWQRLFDNEPAITIKNTKESVDNFNQSLARYHSQAS